MQLRTLSLAVAGLMLAAGSFAANAAVLFQNLGRSAPPAVIGGHAVTPFDQAAQAAIPDFTSSIAVIPGNPGPGVLGISPAATKYTVGSSWNSNWGHPYSGPIFRASGHPVVLTLPAGTKAFYFYSHTDLYGTFTYTVTTDSGTSSGSVAVTSGYGEGSGANGFAFYSTAGESITSITVDSGSPAGFAEFGIATGAATTCASEGYTGTKLLWCQNICEKGYTGATLQTWIHRWVRQFRDLPYCAVEPANPPA